MAEIKPPPVVKYFAAVLYRDAVHLEMARPELVSICGNIDFEGQDHEFDVTDYYEPEMGAPLFRRILSFADLADPSRIVEVKLLCNDIEQSLSLDGRRTVNLDAGYLDHNKVLLASAKEAGQKVYLGSGIYADFAGRYKSGKYQPFEWSFPDFKDGRYDAELIKIRNIYLNQVKNEKRRIA
jgi:hypothetical protein